MTKEVEVARPVGALAIQPNQTKWDDAQLAALRQLGVENASEGDLAVYLNYCQQTGMNPFAKQIYMIGRREKRGNDWIVKQTIQMGIDGFRIVAQRSKEYQGQTKPEWCGPDGIWQEVWLDTVHPPFAARVGVHRKGFVEPLYAIALWSSYAVYYNDVLSPMWKKHGPGQLLKCAEALAIRKAYPMDLSGIYEPTELESMEYQQEVDDAPKMKKSEPVSETIAYTEDDFNNALVSFDAIEQFDNLEKLQEWYNSIPALHDVPINENGLTIKQGVTAKVIELKKIANG